MEKTTRLVEYFRTPEGHVHFGPSTAVIFYSQCGEDLEIYTDFISKNLSTFKNSGTFIELGASDGIKFSNTKFFEDELGFTGILIEPTPGLFELLEKTRPNNKLYNCAISTKKGPVEFLVGGGVGGPWTSGIKDTLSRPHIAKWHASDSKNINVETKKISSIVRDSKIQYIDLFSIDVEGGEYEVLKTVDWDIPIYLIIIEMSDLDSIKDDLCRELLKEKGYKFHKVVGASEIWYDSEYMQKRKQLV